MVVNWLRESSEAIPNVEKTESVAKSDFVRGKNYERPSSTSRPRSSSKKQKAPKRVQLLAPAGAGEGSTEYRKTRFSRERPPELDEAVRRSQNNHLTVDPPPSRVRFPEENDEPEKTKKNFRKTKFSLNRPDGLDELVKSVDRTPEPKVSKGVCFASEDESEDERPEKSRFRKTKFSRNRPEGLDQLIEKTKKVEEPQVREEKGVSFMSEEQEEDQEKIKFRKTKFSLSRPEGIDEIVQNTKSEDPFFLTQNDDLSESDSENKKQRSISFADDEEDNNRDIFGFPSDGRGILAQIFKEIVGENEEQEKEYAGYLGQNFLQQGESLGNKRIRFAELFKPPNLHPDNTSRFSRSIYQTRNR
ncbi:Oidioi.mRNA.OKI2018_I69.PAR.g8721.t2.cds [Oikopleura dioica]|uniref:Oidioi.mRNA.OKI2018_I69.PAR.g8721.t2.cds n=1 Tax=Oikopleura dioica TaxID=34765 RepID=A0ABN7RHA9_OIKDI|nr:Oidioi.mRNA.OKI2018_I69.PAR.g8721.t2.cds [Oikopleura dioica]